MTTHQPTLILFSTLGCHLCDDAKDVCWPLLQQYGYRLQIIDIADDPELLGRYALSIPVVKRSDNANELGWPFTAAQIHQLLEPLQSSDY